MANVYFDRQTGKYYRTDVNGNIVQNVPKSTVRYDNTIKKSTSGNRIYKKPKTVRVYIDKARVAIAVLCTTCILVGGGLTAGVSALIDNHRENEIIYNYSKEFRANGLDKNTKPTKDGGHFYYEYDDIHDYMTRDGADFSQEAYLAYRNMGEHQTNKVLQEGLDSPHSLKSLARSEGYDSVRQWAKAEEEELLLKHDMMEKGYELRRMVDDVDSQARNEVNSYYSDNGYGGK